MTHWPPPIPSHMMGLRTMVFVDGENLAIRYKSLLGEFKPNHTVTEEPNIFVWADTLHAELSSYDLVRRYYYTSVAGDEQRIRDIYQRIKEVAAEEPRVFKKKDKGTRTKRVDISLAVDMLTHAHRKNYDLAILVAGDEDYVPLVEAVKAEGCRVVVWFVVSGLSTALSHSSDYRSDIGRFLYENYVPPE